jgi:hypothetical protein
MTKWFDVAVLMHGQQLVLDEFETGINSYTGDN